MKSSAAAEIFREKERLLLRRGLPLPHDSYCSSTTVASSNGSERRTPSTASTAVPSSNESRQPLEVLPREDFNTAGSQKFKKSNQKNQQQHVPIPRLKYYDNRQHDAVDRGSIAQLHRTPYGQRIPATNTSKYRSPPEECLSKANGRIPSTGCKLHDLPSGRPDTPLIAPRRQGCSISSRLLPAGTPYLSDSCRHSSSEQGLYHNIYYNTSYRIPDNMIPYSISNTRKKTAKKCETNKRKPDEVYKRQLDSQYPAPGEPCSNVKFQRAEGHTKLSWHLIDPFFPDFGHQCLSDEDLVRDLAERLRSLVEQQQPPAGDNAKDLLAAGTWLSIYPVLDIPDAGRLFGLGSAGDPGPSTPLQDAITAVSVEMTTLNEGYERVSAETGLSYDPLVLQPTPDIVRVYNRASVASQRFFISHGPFMDVIPMLRYPSTGSLIPEKFIFSHGSYLRLTAAILLSRFSSLYQIREVLLEGTGHVFPLFPVLDVSQCHAPRELEALIKWSVRSTLEERLVQDSEQMWQKHRYSGLQQRSSVKGNVIRNHPQRRTSNGGTEGLVTYPVPTSPSPEEYCIQLYDCNNFDCLPAALWLGRTQGTFQDHVIRCLEDSVDNPSGEQRFFRQQQCHPDVVHQRLMASRRRLFLGVVPSRETGNFYRLGFRENLTDTESLLLEDTLSLAYGYFYTAQHYSITGSDGSMIYSVLCGRLPEVALYDCLIMMEKLRLALRHSDLHPIAREGLRTKAAYEAVNEQYQRDVEEHNQKNARPHNALSEPPVSATQSTMTPEPVLWTSNLLLEQYDQTCNETDNPSNMPVGPTLHSVAVMLFEFFPGKKMMDLELLCRAVVQDTMLLGGLNRIVKPEEYRNGSTSKNNLLFINEVARAMMAVILEQDALRQYRSQDSSTFFSYNNNIPPVLQPPPPPLVFEDKIVTLLLTRVAVDTLFQYHSFFFDHDGDMWFKSNLAECLRMLYTAEVFQYASEMQVAILSAECRGYQQIPLEWLAVQPYSYPWPPEMQRSFLRLRQLSIKFSIPTTGVASVRAVLEAVHRADPLKTPTEAQEYVHHLLILYFRDHMFPPLHPQYPGDRESNVPMVPQELVDAVTLMDWFGGAPTLSLCDTIYVDLYALAALCPLVLGRRLVVYAGDSGSESSAPNSSTV